VQDRDIVAMDHW